MPDAGASCHPRRSRRAAESHRARRGVSAEFMRFLTDISHGRAQHVEPWKARAHRGDRVLGGEGYRTGPLERALSDAASAAERRGAAQRVRGERGAAPRLERRSCALDRGARRARRVPRS